MKNLTLICIICFVSFWAFTDDKINNVSNVRISTKAPSNKHLKFWYRKPIGYKTDEKKLYRVLVLFGGRNCTGEKQATGMLGFDKWADENNVFLVAPGYKDDEYWYPKKWSGKALLEALGKIRKKYPICTDKILYYGYSAGSQCSNLFPAWKPKICRAWVSHACGVFYKPTKKMKDVPGLVTCGEADIGRYELSRRFIFESRRKGCNILWKSFPNVQHDVPPGTVELAKAFLAFYHKKYADDLIMGKKKKKKSRKKTVAKVLFVGDDQEGRYWQQGDPAIEDIDKEERVEFTSETLAKAWGKPARSKWSQKKKVK